MADLSAGKHADIVLSATEVLRVVTEGNTDVVAQYGAPSGTTPVNSASVDFGPYGVPAKLQVNCNTGRGSYFLRTYEPVAALDNGSVVTVLASDSPATIVSKIESINPPVGSSGGTEWSDGVGRRVELITGRILVPAFMISQAQSLRGVKGSTIVGHDGSPINPTAVGGTVGGFVTVKDDFRNHGGIPGQGVIEDLDIDATIGGGVSKPATVHGFYMPARSGSATAHTVRNVTVYGAPNNGIHIDTGNDKLVAQRMRSEGAGGVGIYIAGADCKGSDFGSVAVGSACEINGAAVELDKFDFWRPSGANSDPTLKITGGTNGVVIKSGTIEGKTLLIGKNESNTNRYINSKMQFAFVHFKQKDQTFDCLLEVQSADLVELLQCKWGWSGNDVITPFPYLIKITNTGGSDRNGFVKIIGASGMMRFLGRVGAAANRMRVDCSKHICDHPDRLLFEWGRLGQVDVVPNWVTTDATLKTHIPFDGGTYNVAEYQIGYLSYLAHIGDFVNDLSTAPATFTMPEYPVISSYAGRGLRCVL